MNPLWIAVIGTNLGMIGLCIAWTCLARAYVPAVQAGRQAGGAPMTEPCDTMFNFPNCMHAMSAALHRASINPADVEIILPRDDWWRLWNRLEHVHRGMMMFDGRGELADRFRYMGFTFRAKPREPAVPDYTP